MMWYSTGLETARNRSTASTTVAYAENMDEMSFGLESGLELIENLITLHMKSSFLVVLHIYIAITCS